jgi:DNA gyrase subunit A
VKDDDYVDRLYVANTHDTILCFSSLGKIYWLKVHQIPQARRGARGKPIVNLLRLEQNEQVNAILPIRDIEQGKYILMATSNGTVKKTALSEFSRPRPSGIIAIELVRGNRLVGVGLSTGKCDILLFSDAGKVVRFDESEARPLGRTAKGVRGITLKKGHAVISAIIACEDVGDATVLTATKNGFGKRSLLTDYPRHKRGGQGVISIQVSKRNGRAVGACLVTGEDEVMLITKAGKLIRTRTREISIVGRNTQGVHLIDLSENESLARLEKVAESPNGGNID